MLLTTKPVMNPNLAPIHHPIQPKTIMPAKIQSLFISYPTRIMANDDYTVLYASGVPHKTGQSPSPRTKYSLWDGQAITTIDYCSLNNKLKHFKTKPPSVIPALSRNPGQFRLDSRLRGNDKLCLAIFSIVNKNYPFPMLLQLANEDRPLYHLKHQASLSDLPGDIQLQYRVKAINVSSNAVYAVLPSFFIFFSSRFSFNVFCAFFFTSLLASWLWAIHYPFLNTSYSIVSGLTSLHWTTSATSQHNLAKPNFTPWDDAVSLSHRGFCQYKKFPLLFQYPSWACLHCLPRVQSRGATSKCRTIFAYLNYILSMSIYKPHFPPLFLFWKFGFWRFGFVSTVRCPVEDFGFRASNFPSPLLNSKSPCWPLAAGSRKLSLVSGLLSIGLFQFPQISSNRCKSMKISANLWISLHIFWYLYRLFLSINYAKIQRNSFFSKN